MQYRFNSIKNLTTRLKLNADYYNIYDLIPNGIDIIDTNDNNVLWLTGIQKNSDDKYWYLDWKVPEYISVGLYKLKWYYQENNFSEPKTITEILSVHELPDEDEFKFINSFYFHLMPQTIIPIVTKFVELSVDCPNLSVIPELYCRILNYLDNYTVLDWHELECSGYKEFVLDLRNIKLEHKYYVIEGKIVCGNNEILSEQVMIPISNRRSGLDLII